MPGTPTPILALTVPTVNGDSGIWGSELNGDLAILDGLGALSVVNVSSNYNAVPGVAPENVIRVTTGTLTLTITLPPPALYVGRVFVVKKVDAGLGMVSVVASGGAAIDGQGSYIRDTQYSYVRLLATAGGYDVIGGN